MQSCKVDSRMACSGGHQATRASPRDQPASGGGTVLRPLSRPRMLFSKRDDRRPHARLPDCFRANADDLHGTPVQVPPTPSALMPAGALTRSRPISSCARPRPGPRWDPARLTKHTNDNICQPEVSTPPSPTVTARGNNRYISASYPERWGFAPAVPSSIYRAATTRYRARCPRQA